MIAVSSLLAGKYDEYSRLFIEIPFLPCQPDLHTAPGGRYLKAFHKDPLTDFPGGMKKFLLLPEHTA